MADWKELSGNNNWAGLLKPLKKDLGEYIIFYGDRVQELYDSIDSDPNSATYELPKYDEKGFFPGVGDDMYTMETYLNASAEVMSQVDSNARNRPAPIGYVAVATEKGKKELGRRDILVCFRGTMTIKEWIIDMKYAQTSASVTLGQRPENPRVHKGFFSIYLSVRKQLLEAVRKLVDKYQNEEISITVAGHSLGAALGALASSDIVSNKFNRPTGSSKECMVTVFSLASPKVGNKGFTTVFNELSTNLHLLHTKHVRDIVPRLPPSFIYEYSKLPGFDLNINVNIPASLDGALTLLDGANNLPLVLSWFDVLKYHYLKNLLKAIRAQEGKSSLILDDSNWAVEQLQNGDWKLFVAAPQAQMA